MTDILPAAIDALLALPAMGRAALSPDGRLVAWSWYRKAPAADIYVAPTDGAAAPLRLTATPNDTALVSWAPDSASLVVAEDRGGNEHVQLFRLTLASSVTEPGTMTPLTEASPPFFARGGELDAGGRYLVFAANLDPASGAAIEASWIIRQDLASGARLAVAKPAKPHAFRPLLSKDGTKILYTRRDRDPAGTQIWLVDIDGGNDREILDFGAAVKTSASWFPDSRRALVIADAATHKRLGIYDTGDGSLRWLIDDPTRAIEGAFVPDRGGRIVVAEVREARSRAFLLDPLRDAEMPVVGDRCTLLPMGQLPDGVWLGRVYGATQPDEIVRFELPADGRPPHPDPLPQGGRGLDGVSSSPYPLAGEGRGEGMPLAQPFSSSILTAADLVAPEDFRWRSLDGLEIQGWLYRPTTPAKGLVVQVHGGPTAHSEDALSAFIQACVAAGFAVLDPNYRGSTGFGLKFREAIRQDGWGGREQDDIRTGAEAVIARGLAPAGKVAVTGTSYGGYSSWCAATRWPATLLAASAPICGMTDLVVDYYSTRPDLRPYSEEMLGGSPEQVPERYRQRSPIHFVDRISAQLLIVQGMNDPNVTPENLHQVEAALKAAAIPYETLLFEDEGHGIRKPKNLRILYSRLIAFFAAAFAGWDE
ncbi:MAG TPA: prolyl oligopeptidase family serine peptidase [Stellaceae bacterium]|jgi:dipeptidyl aminopeptidase/acylaminoacyl peptidase|nr:prolyl oligopeptidase family serine peptidase [Stellaceae bacterium]